jgi:hypothetical protein
MYNLQNLDFFSFTFAMDFSTNIIAMLSKLGAFGSFDVASLGLIEVNNIPDGSEILLIDYVSFHAKRNRDKLTSALTFLYWR